MSFQSTLNITSKNTDCQYKQGTKPKKLTEIFASTTENEQGLSELAFPLSFKTLTQEQQKDQLLINKAKNKGSK